MKRRLRISFNLFVAAALGLLFSGCIDPVEPEFAFREGLVYIDALIASSPGASYVNISESAEVFGLNDVVNVNGARVSFVNVQTSEEVLLNEDEDGYIPPMEFAASTGESWRLSVVFPDGREYESLPETVLSSVPIDGLRADYDPELVFSEEFNRIVPGHRISVGFDDPAGQENYYFWRYRTFEDLIYCAICFDGILRDGGCTTNTPEQSAIREAYYSYGCIGPCWRIRYADNIAIFSDQFSDGNAVSSLPIADILLYNNENIVIEVQQFAISPSAYEYLRALKDLIDNNSGLNAPLPAVLVGNLFNPEDPDEFVLGRFTAASAATEQLFIERIFIQEPQLEERIIGLFEDDRVMDPPTVTNTPCEESRFRTAVRPAAWED
ncbi:DUF4249 domain-containing protein [Poritiphilus flavus]|uniref:DUF4249 family protein n=1 Tax=Poritiphilus flavus TaxID=2697053 RepID=A0A6L9E6X4_9FLAO|nr:DUF4249 domain-containing protein [Poritiphilus flavus]NAS10378.1 DUF4249 family protein [Poritiphilus flavus]